MKFQVLPKAELMRRMERFLADKNRGISIGLFADLCGYEITVIKRVFQQKTVPMSETLQIRVSKGLWEIEQGRVMVMERENRQVYWKYRKEDKPRMTRKNTITLTNDGIKLKLGIGNRNDYSGVSLAEQLDKKHGR